MSSNSESKTVERKKAGQPEPVYVVPYRNVESEISLVDLWRIIVAGKYIILLSILVAVALATAYLFVTEPVYRSEANLLPPKQQDIQALTINYQDNGAPTMEGYRPALVSHEFLRNIYTPALVYEEFLRNIKSRGLRREYFDANGLADHYLPDGPGLDVDIERVFDKFNRNMDVRDGKKEVSSVVVSFLDVDPRFAARCLNKFIDFANRRTVAQLVSDVNAVIRSERDRVRYQLESKLKLAAQRRQDRILSLREALRIAKALGIEGAGSVSMTSERDGVAIAVNTAQSPLYMRGIKALEAEIAVLGSRKSDEPFIPEVRDLQEKLTLLEGISVDQSKVSAVSIDAAGREPYGAVKPNNKLVIMLAIVFGFLGGIFLVFISNFLSKAHE